MAKQLPNATIDAITISSYQIMKGNLLNKKEDLHHKVKMVESNFENLPYPNEHFDYSYALESACHSHLDNNLSSG